jgi:hypothetical protein
MPIPASASAVHGIFFYITNDRTTPASEIVFLANDRCDQENLIGQLLSPR